jgi:hypothetical protein
MDNRTAVAEALRLAHTQGFEGGLKFLKENIAIKNLHWMIDEWFRAQCIEHGVDVPPRPAPPQQDSGRFDASNDPVFVRLDRCAFRRLLRLQGQQRDEL